MIRLPAPALSGNGSLGAWQDARIAHGAVTLASLQADIERARGEYALKRYDSVGQILDKLLPSLRGSLERLPQSDRAQYALLLASAYSLKGRFASKRGDEDRASAAFRESAMLFRDYPRELASQTARGRFYTDFGIALVRLGRYPEALNILEQALETGAAPIEAFGYKGLAHRELGEFDQAIDLLGKGLQSLPGDTSLASLLAETFDRAGRSSEAAAAYKAAALANIREGDLRRADELLSRALELSLTDPETISAATVVKCSLDRMAGAIALLERVLRRDPRHATARALKALLLRERGERAAAIDLLRDVDPQTPDLSWVLVELARTLHEAGSEHDAEAIELLHRASQLNPAGTDALVLEAELLRDEDIDKVLDRLRDAAQVEPQSAPLRYALARALVRRREFLGAAAELEELLRIDRRSIEALGTMGYVLLQLGRAEEALDMFRRAALVQPGEEAIFRQLVDALVAQGRGDEAIDELAREIAERPSQWAYRMRGEVLLSRNELVGALEALDAANDIGPEDIGVETKRGEVLLRLEKYNCAGEVLDRALVLASTSADVLGMKAFHSCQVAAFDEAVGLLDRALGAAPDLAWLQALLGWAAYHAATPDFPRAEAAYHAAIALDPHNPWHRKGLANILYDTGRKGDGEKIFDELIGTQSMGRADAANTSSLALLAWCYYRRRRYDEAVRLLSSVARETEEIGLHFDLALALLATGRTAGIDEYRNAVERAAAKETAKQRGLLYVALFDLVNAVRDNRIAKEGQDALDLLCSRLEGLGVDLQKLHWLDGRFPTPPAPA